MKTKEMAGILSNLLTKELKNQGTKEQPSMLLTLSTMDKNIILSARNIPKVATIQAKDLNCLDLLCYKYLLMPKDAIGVIKRTFLENAK
jgi:ribosomal protein L4